MRAENGWATDEPCWIRNNDSDYGKHFDKVQLK